MRGSGSPTERDVLLLLHTLAALELVRDEPSGGGTSSLTDTLDRLLRPELVELTLGVRLWVGFGLTDGRATVAADTVEEPGRPGYASGLLGVLRHSKLPRVGFPGAFVEVGRAKAILGQILCSVMIQ